MKLKSKYQIGTKVRIVSGRFTGFEGIVEDHFYSQNTETGKYEAGATIIDTDGERRDAFDSRIEVIKETATKERKGMKVSEKIDILVGTGNWAIRNQSLQRILDTKCEDDEIPEFKKNGRDVVALVYTGEVTKGGRWIHVAVRKAGEKIKAETGKDYIVT
ncbi:hypothetical protein [Brevibacillus brevis]|uniref:hypothetical protein n=1 Tax=Brevibacillus brevis TaxID=1393 RepID=UPI0007D8B328|nr:hypothetical protein [Brevibacillus brevis]